MGVDCPRYAHTKEKKRGLTNDCGGRAHAYVKEKLKERVEVESGG